MDPSTATEAAGVGWGKVGAAIFVLAMALTQAAPSVTKYKAWNWFMWAMNRIAGNNFKARNADEPKK